MKKTLAALALAGSIALVGSSPAMATYVPTPPPAAVSDGTVGPGQTFTFSGRYNPFAGESLTIRVTPGNPPAASGAAVGNRSVGSRISVFVEAQTLTGYSADAEGDYSVPITIREAGTYFITATGNTSGNTAGPVTVVVDPAFASNGAPLSGTGGGASLANTGSGLANTGADSGLVLWTLVGAGALAAGATSVVVVRRRAKAEVAA
jgi:LPXTG-motif cell wall-anchored protein